MEAVHPATADFTIPDGWYFTHLYDVEEGQEFIYERHGGVCLRGPLPLDEANRIVLAGPKPEKTVLVALPESTVQHWSRVPFLGCETKFEKTMKQACRKALGR